MASILCMCYYCTFFFFSLLLTVHKYQKKRKSLHLQACMLQVLSSTWCRYWIPTPAGPHLTFTIFCLETVLRAGWSLLFVCSSFTARKCIFNNYWFPCTPHRERECHYASTNCPFPVVSFCMHTHTLFLCVCICVYCMSLCLTTHGFTRICTEFAFVLLVWGGEQALLMQEVSLTV